MTFINNQDANEGNILVSLIIYIRKYTYSHGKLWTIFIRSFSKGFY